MRYLIYPLLAIAALACSTADEPTALSSTKEVTVSNRFLSSDEAGDIAAAFMTTLGSDNEKSRGVTTWSVDGVQLIQKRCASRASDSDTTFYVVDFNEGGYAIVAADRDLDNKVYVYSPVDEFNGEDNPALDVFLENAIATMHDAPRRSEMENLAHLSRKRTEPDPLAPATGEECIHGVWYVFYCYGSHNVKAPLLTTEWHQYRPYNTLCTSKKGYDTLVGCVAIAMGQICSYHRWPEQLNNYTYNWDNMLAQSSHGTTYDIGAYDIAHLLSEIGNIVKMNYGHYDKKEGSGTNIDNALKGFKSMGYNSAEKKKFSIGDITYSLTGDRPVYMRGKDPSKNVGHAWVVDGHDSYTARTEYYNKETGELHAIYGGLGYNYLHFNAGQGGSGNGYYLCAGGGINGYDGKDFSTFGFTSDNQIITNIKR